MMLRTLIAAGAILTAAACATPTPYREAAGPHDDGYSVQRIETDRFRVAFAGNSLTDLQTVETYLLYRAAEITLQQGADWFAILDRDTESDRRVVGSRFGPRYGGFHRAYYHPAFGWRPWYDPFWDDVSYREITRYVASAEIRVGRGAYPRDDPSYYDAADVRATLGSSIQWPEQ